MAGPFYAFGAPIFDKHCLYSIIFSKIVKALYKKSP